MTVYEPLPAQQQMRLGQAQAGYIYRTRAAAGIGSAGGLGVRPTPGLRESARAAPRTRKYRQAARPGCNGAQWPHVVRQQQPRALLDDTGLQSRPTTDGSTETPNADAHVTRHTYVQTVQSPTCSPGPVQPPQSFNYELDRPGYDTRPLRRDMSCATISADKVVLTRCVQHLPPPTSPADTHAGLMNPPGPRPASQYPSR
jgi:hypothetical protein